MPRNVQTKVISPTGVQLSALATSHGLTMAELAVKSSIAESDWAAIIDGSETISQDEIAHVADALDLVRRTRALKSTRTVEDIRHGLKRSAGYTS